jgi:hypothetical protein
MIASPFRRRALLVVALTVAASAAPLVIPPAEAAYAGTPAVVYSRLAADGASTELWAAAADMSGKHVVWRSSTYNVEFPQLSQDGTTVAFGGWKSVPFTSRIYTIDAAGTGLVRWTTPVAPFIDVHPTWAPDKSAIYFTRLDISTRASRLYRVTGAGVTPTPIAGTSGADFATVSPDGNYLAFDRAGSIVVAKTDGTDAFVLRRGTAADGFRQPRWSPNGRSIAAVRDVRGSQMSLVVLHTSDAAHYTVTAHTPYSNLVGAPAWTHDSGQLYYSLLTGSESTGYAYNLRRVAAVSGATSQAITSNPADGTWEWSPYLGGGAGPAPDTTASPAVLGTTSVAIDNVILRYAADPAGPDAARFVVRYQAGAVPPATVNDGTFVYSGLRRARQVTGLAPQTTYSFSVFAVDWSGNVAAPATTTVTTARRSSFTGSTSVARLVYGASVQVRGQLLDAVDVTPVAGKPVALYARTSSTAPWVKKATATTDAAGAVALSRTPSRNTTYQWRYAGDSDHGPAATALLPIAVATKVSSAFDDATIRLGKSARLHGRVAPSHAGRTVYLQRRLSDGWHTVRSMALSSTSGYSFTFKPSRTGKFVYRVVRPADSDHAKGISATRTLTVS